MNILYDHQIFIDQIYGGPSKYFLKIIEKILHDHDVKICAPIHLNNYLQTLPKKNVIGYKLNDLYLRSLPYRLKDNFIKNILNKINITYLNYISKSFKPDILHRTNFNAYKTNTPVVITVYDLIHEKFHDMYGKNFKFRPKKEAIEMADEIICISKNTLKDLSYYYDLKNRNVSVIYLGSSFSLKNKNYQNLELKVKENYILYVGKRNNYKNFDNFIKAYSLSSNLKKDLKIYCFGGGSFSKNEIKMFNCLNVPEGNIKYFSGDENTLEFFYKNAKALVYPSKYEGFGLPVLEAMSLGCPVICSKVASIPEIGGDTVVYFNPYDVEDIKESIYKVIYSDDKRLEIRKKALKRAELFSWSKCANETVGVYKKLL
jgi:glycosyltransferase involved in cell wall biosynthesis